MITNYLTRLYCGMVYRLFPIRGTGTKTTTGAGTVHWEESPGAPEEEIKELLDDIRTRVSILKEVVAEQSAEIEVTLNETERVVDDMREDDNARIEQLVMDIDERLDKLP